MRTKYMNSTFTNFLAIFTIIFIQACGDGGADNGDIINPPSPNPAPTPTPPVWNKENTAQISFFSTLSDTSIPQKTQIYKDIIKHLTGAEQLILIDKSDVNLSSKFNGSIQVANAIKGYHFYGINRVTDKIVEGTGIITRKRRGGILYKDGTDANVDVTAVKKDVFSTNKIGDNIYLSGTNTYVNNKIAFPFATVRFENNNQINKAKTIFSNMMNGDVVIIGSIPNTVTEQLTLFVESFKNATNYKLDIITSKSNRNLFIIHPYFWVLRNHSITKLSDGIFKCNLEIEANVF